MMILVSGASAVMAEIQTKEITYSGGGADMQGFLAWDDAIEGERPGILVVHEWWGHNDYPRARARMLAELGYTALSLDMYGDGKTADHPKDASTFMSAVIQNMEAGRERFNAAHELLKNHETVDGSKTGAIGYCFGGGVVLHMARMGADLDVVASFHGSLGLAKAPGPDTIDTRVVAYNGEADPFVTAEAIEAFKAEMDSVGANYELIQFEGAIHGFTNPAATGNGEKFDLPLKYDVVADKASWAHLQTVLEAAFKD
ncbi:MAG: dienelactone hydrolase family protein [Xanthomonadales bacterium]|nr:dienelactone hydrolase family protein [Xanthomonadales bacterium]